MKKILGYVLTIALLIGLFPTVIFAEEPTYCYDSANVVGSCRLTAQAQTDDVLSNTTGGIVIRKNVDAKYFECGGGVWTFGTVANSGYRFVGWEHSVSWEELHHCKWISKREVNPEKIDGIIFPHIDNRNGNGAFHSDEDHMAIHHIGCNVQEGIRNVHYNIIAKFERITATLTINHYRETRNLSGDLLLTEPVVTETKEGKFENDKVKPSQYKKNYKGYKFDNTRNDKTTLVAGANELNVYYIKTIDDTPVSSDTSSTTSSDTSSTTSSDTSSTTSSDTSSTTSSDTSSTTSSDTSSTTSSDTSSTTSSDTSSTTSSDTSSTTSSDTSSTTSSDTTPTAFKVYHIGITKYLSGKADTSADLASPYVVIRNIGDKVQPSQLKNTYAGYTFDTTRDNVITLQPEIKLIYVYYLRTVDDRPTPPPYNPPTPPYDPPVTETIVEEETPLAPVIEPETIEEEEVPLAPVPTKAPQTGDATPIGILLWLAVASSAVLVAGKIKRLKESN